MKPHYRLHVREHTHVEGSYVWYVADQDLWRTRWCDTVREACEQMRAGLVY